jgi:hypothetical protein
MKVDVRHVDDVILVDLEGRLVMGVGDELLREVINELLAEGWKKIVLNLRAVTIMDSSGMGELVSGWKIAAALRCDAEAAAARTPGAADAEADPDHAAPRGLRRGGGGSCRASAPS